MKSCLRLFACTLLLMAACVAAAAGSTKQTVAAKALFARYVSLEHAFDPDVADLYSDNALIQNTRKYPDGRVRTIEIPALRYKQLIDTAMPIAKSRGDYSTYSKVAYATEGQNVRITATRRSVRKNYSSPIALLVGSDNTGKWVILEEISESQP